MEKDKTRFYNPLFCTIITFCIKFCYRKLLVVVAYMLLPPYFICVIFIQIHQAISTWRSTKYTNFRIYNNSQIKSWSILKKTSYGLTLIEYVYTIQIKIVLRFILVRMMRLVNLGTRQRGVGEPQLRNARVKAWKAPPSILAIKNFQRIFYVNYWTSRLVLKMYIKRFFLSFYYYLMWFNL